ncbi:MAG TPA: glycosyltransferase [Solirubrobacteraceae bacterium]|nr:glycosyltransferase [Solirubrobacteraceae bacterium]
MSALRVAVYLDQAFWRDQEGVTTRRSFVVFLDAVAASFDRVLLLGRVAPEAGRADYAVPGNLEFVALPWYRNAADPIQVARALAGSVRRFWRVLRDVDMVWLFGPQPVAIAFAALAALRGRKVVLGVRQDLPAYARHRHPGRRLVHLAADALEAAFRLLGRRCSVVVVGPGLARGYRHSRRLLEASVSLVRADQVVDEAVPAARAYDGPLRLLSVGRLDAEKNPLLLADILQRLVADDGRWRLVVCGDGPLEADLAARLRELGLEGNAELRGHVPITDGLVDLYRGSHAFLHVSWTEGVPQVLFEAFAAGLPVVATAVGGVAQAAGDAALLVGPGDAEAPARELRRIAADPALRERLGSAARARALAHTQEAEAGRVAAFLSGAAA